LRRERRRGHTTQKIKENISFWKKEKGFEKEELKGRKKITRGKKNKNDEKTIEVKVSG